MLQKKFEDLANSLKAQFHERDAVVEGMVCAALAGEHVLLLGPPGTAKSALANQFCQAISGAKFFQWLLSRFSSPGELFGPVSLKALKEDSYKRQVTGKLPEAHVAFLDEIFKANSAILNSLLTAINERKFHNNGGASDIPLRLVVGASNELPDGPELAALYDRFLVRYWIEYVNNPDAFLDIMQGSEPSIDQAMSLEEWDAARAEVRAVGFDREAARALYKLRQGLKKEGVEVSDRRWKRCVKLVQANAWMSGDTEVSEDHFSLLSDALWDEPGQREAVAIQVQSISASVVGEAKKVADAFQRLVKGIPAEPNNADKSYQEALIATNREGNRAVARLKELEGKAKTKSQRSKIADIMKAVETDLEPLRVIARQSLGL